MYSYVLSSALDCTRAERQVRSERQETFCSGRLGYAKTTSLNEMFPTTVCNVRPTRSLHASITTARSAVWMMVMAARRAFASAVKAGSTCPRPCAPILAHAPWSFSLALCRLSTSMFRLRACSMSHVMKHVTSNNRASLPAATHRQTGWRTDLTGLQTWLSSDRLH